MAPKGGTRKVTRTSCTTTRLRRRRRRRKEKKLPLFYQDSRPPSSDSVDVSVSPDRDHCIKEEDSGVCSTPKGERYKIPETGTCPPAPKKHRPRCWSRGRRSYFSSPEIEAFFLHALGGISV